MCRAASALIPVVSVFVFLIPAESNEHLQVVGPMGELRASHTATVLHDGKVLVAGGFKKVRTNDQEYFTSAELYDPLTRQFTPTGELATARCGHTATLLRDGTVLIAGGTNGQSLSSAELYDPAAGKFHTVGDMATPREGHTATLLNDGNVLIVGGCSDPHAGAEIFDVPARRFRVVEPVGAIRIGHTATLLPDGKVLIAGGTDKETRDRVIYASAEIFDPSTDWFTPTGPMSVPRYKHASVLLADGRVLVIGGSDSRDWQGQYKSAEIFTESSGTFSPIKDMNAERFKLPAAVVALNDHSILVTGGSTELERFSPEDEEFTIVGTLPEPRYYQASVLLPDGSVLMTGGYDGIPQSTDRAWVYRP